MKRSSLLIVLLVVAAAAVLSAGVKPAKEPRQPPPPVAQAQAAGEQAAPVPAAQPHAAEARPAGDGAHEGAAAGHGPAASEESAGSHEGGESIWATVARLFNFALLAGSLIYLLRSPFGAFLASRQVQVRKSLTDAAATREDAAKQLEAIDHKLGALPGELEALKRRGAVEIAAEEERIRQAAEVERQRLVANGKREIERRAHLAERELLTRASELAVGVAAERVKRAMTDADQVRLVDRYLEQMRLEAPGS